MADGASSDRRLLYAGGIVAACAGVAVVLVLTADPVETAPHAELTRPVRVVSVQPQTLRLSVRSQGTVEPRVQSDLVPEVSGRVVWVSPTLAPGGYFSAGDPLVRLEKSDTEDALRRARAQQVRARAEHTYAERTLARRLDLRTNSVLSAAQLEESQRSERTAFAALEEARVAVSQAERDLARTELVAPFDGRARDKSVDVGQFVDRGDRIATLYAIDYAEVRLPIEDAELAFLELPLGASSPSPEAAPAVTLSARFGGTQHRWQGRIVRTEGEIDPRTRMVHVIARVARPYAPGAGRAPLAAGLFVQAEIRGREVDGVFALPRAALRAGDRLLVVDAADRLRERSVEVLRVERDRALVGSGLTAGERVCVTDVPVFVENMPVRPIPVPADEGAT
ncbi:MAG: efflux RND transporter periplasmic adaptor subunit [Proteobacteria bacterium]|nr:efflux RND transporter periplasmic adaptor subunit [Pseudomonadota bacterium]